MMTQLLLPSLFPLPGPSVVEQPGAGQRLDDAQPTVEQQLYQWAGVRPVLHAGTPPFHVQHKTY